MSPLPTASSRRLRRGQPIVALVLLLGSWATVRALVWEPPFPAAVQEDAPRLAQAAPVAAPRAAKVEQARNRQAWGAHPLPAGGAAAMPVPRHRPEPLPRVVPEPLAPAPETPVPVAPRLAAGHQMLWMAAVSRMPLLFAAGAGAPVAPYPVPVPFRPVAQSGGTAPGRWSADGWLMLRRDGGRLPSAPGMASYGANQLGAVARYHLDPASPHRPTAYLRASAALNGAPDREVAAGFAVRPAKGVPVVAMAEVRVAAGAAPVALRPAVALVTELAPFDLPLGTRAEVYGQAGYVGGAAGTAFADGQVRVDRSLARVGAAELRAGAGAWGGAQKGAERLDVGPTATLSLSLGRASARMGVDWRFRVAGEAEPPSGPALTLSAGF